MRQAALGTWLLLGLTPAVFAVLAWNRRWMSDDGRFFASLNLEFRQEEVQPRPTD